MKLVFSTKHVNRASFLDLCRYAYDYGYTGFEIYDALKERRQHADSVLRNDRAADSNRKLLNRGLSVSALTIPQPVESEEVTSALLLFLLNICVDGSAVDVIGKKHLSV